MFSLFFFFRAKDGLGQKRPLSADGPDPTVASPCGQYVLGTKAGGIYALPVVTRAACSPLGEGARATHSSPRFNKSVFNFEAPEPHQTLNPKPNGRACRPAFPDTLPIQASDILQDRTFQIQFDPSQVVSRLKKRQTPNLSLPLLARTLAKMALPPFLFTIFLVPKKKRQIGFKTPRCTVAWTCGSSHVYSALGFGSPQNVGFTMSWASRPSKCPGYNV